MAKLISGENYFNDKSFNEACEALESGEVITVFIDCIGHGTNNREQENYKDALIEKYGSNLSVECSDGAYSYSYTYCLRHSAGGKND